MEKEATNITYQDYLFNSFYRAYSSKRRQLTERDEALLHRLAMLCCGHCYDSPMKPSTVRKALLEAKRTNKLVKLVPDSQFWKNGNCHGQCDGWSYHLVVYSPPNMVNGIRFYKKHSTDRVWWVNNPEYVGRLEFSFDRKKIYSL